MLRRLSRRAARPDDARVARAATRTALKTLLGHDSKFPLGKKIAAHARVDLAWMETELADERAANPSTRLLAWTREMDPATLLDSWAETVDPDHRVGIIGDARAKYLRRLDDLGRRLHGWLTLETPPNPGSMEAGFGARAARDLVKAVRAEGTSWIEGWGGGPSSAFGKLLIVWLLALIAEYPDHEPT